MSDDGCPTDPALLALDYQSGRLIKPEPSLDPIHPSPAPPPASAASSSSSRRKSGAKKRAHTTLSEKVMIINFIRSHPSWDQATVAKHFQLNGFPTLSQSTISRYIKDEERYRNLALDPSKWNVKKQKQARSPQIINCIDFWLHQAIGKSFDPNLPNHRPIMLKKWKEFEVLLSMRYKKKSTPTHSFESYFKNPHKRFLHPHQVRPTTPVDLETERERLRSITSQYSPEDILAMDEIGLAYSCPPSDPASLCSLPKLTLALTCSSDGSWKDNPLIVGQTPMSVAYPSDQISDNCGFSYHWNTKAVMTCAIWENYLTNLNGKCRQRGRKVILLVDVTHVHLLPDPPLSHVQIEFIDTARMFSCHPSNSPCHPFTVGITKYFKSEYRVRFCLRALSSDEFGLLDLYNLDQAAATRIIQDAWNCVTPSAISNTFKHSGLISDPFSLDDDSQYAESNEGILDGHLPFQDPSIEQSIASLEMCLTQLTIKVMNLSEQTESEVRTETSPRPAESDPNINPELTAQAARVTGGIRSDPPQKRHKKPEEQIVSAHEFIDIDVSLPTEVFWDEQDIVDQVLRESKEALVTMTTPSALSNSVSLEPSQIGLYSRPRKRGPSSIEDHADITVADNKPAPSSSRRRKSSPSEPAVTSVTHHTSNNLFEQPNHEPLLTPEMEHGDGLDSSFHSGHHQSQYNELSNFSQQISNLESLRTFCVELIERNKSDDELSGGRLRSSVVQDCLPILVELEDEFKALEAADLLRLVSG